MVKRIENIFNNFNMFIWKEFNLIFNNTINFKNDNSIKAWHHSVKNLEDLFNKEYEKYGIKIKYRKDNTFFKGLFWHLLVITYIEKLKLTNDEIFMNWPKRVLNYFDLLNKAEKYFNITYEKLRKGVKS